MNSRIVGIVCGLSLASVALPGSAAEPADLRTDPQKNSYSAGYDIGRSVRRQLVGVDAEAMARGLRDALGGVAPALSDQEMQQRFTALQQESARKIQEKNRQDGEAFLAANKGKKGVKTTASGLQYKVITRGKGKKPTAADTVTVHYRGTLIDGSEFDSSYKRGQPARFPVKGVIAGWTEALQLMPAGSKWMLYVPATLAYGARGAGSMIGPHSTLIFEVELLSVGEAEPPR